MDAKMIEEMLKNTTIQEDATLECKWIFLRKASENKESYLFKDEETFSMKQRHHQT